MPRTVRRHRRTLPTRRRSQIRPGPDQNRPLGVQQYLRLRRPPRRHDPQPGARHVANQRKTQKGKPQALTAAGIRQLRAYVTYDPVAQRRDLPDLIDVMAATGVRIGEALAVVWDAVNLDAKTIEVRGTVIRIKAIGLVIKPEPKTEAGYRTLILPDWAIPLMRARRQRETLDFGELGLVFPSAVGTIRDPSNVDHQIKNAFTYAGLPDLTSHVLRNTVATLMDEAGLTARQAADQLGHAKVSMTQDIYFARKILDTGAAEALKILDFDSV